MFRRLAATVRKLHLGRGWDNSKRVVAFVIAAALCAVALIPSRALATTFTFTLNARYVTTAGAFNAEGQLVRTIWRRVTYDAGSHTGVWDDKDDAGNAVPSGSYTIKVLFHNVSEIWDGTIGNTSSAVAGRHVWRGFDPVPNLAIAGNDAFVAFGYNEGQNGAARFDTSNPQSITYIGKPDPFTVFQYVATDGVHAYYPNAGGGLGADGRKFTFTMAFNVADNTTYTFPKGVPVGLNNNSDWYTSCIDVDQDDSRKGINQPTGIAVQLTGPILAIAHGPRNLIRLFDKTSGDAIGSINVPNPRSLAFAPNGDLWAISGKSAERFGGADLGRANSPVSTVADLSDPLNIAVDPVTSNVLVADGGTSQQVKAFNSAGALQWAYGQPGGYAANGIAVTNDKFQFRNTVNWVGPVTALAAAPDGSFWVDDTATSRLMHISSQRKFIDCVEYVPLTYSCSADPIHPTRVFGGDFLEFAVDYTKPLAAGNGSWTLVNNWAATLPDSSPFFTGSQQGSSHVTTLANGRVYGTMNCKGSGPHIVELTNAGIRDTGIVLTNYASFAGDGSVRFDDIQGSVQRFYALPVLGFDNEGNPRYPSPSGNTPWYPGEAGNFDPSPYAIAAADATPLPQAGDGGRAPNIPVTSTGVLVAYDQSTKPGMHLGGLVAKAGAGATVQPWLWRSMPSVTSDVPPDGLGSYDIGDGVNYAGNLALVSGRSIFLGYNGEFWAQSQMSQWMHFYDDGLFVSQFGTPGRYLVPSQPGGATPGFAGNSFSPSIVNTAEGTFLWHNDEANHGGLIRWHLMGDDTIEEALGTGSLGSQIALTAPPPAFPTGLTALPGNGAVRLTWNAAAGATAYKVSYSTVNGGPWTAIPGVSGTRYVVRSLVNGRRYYFTVAAESASGMSAQANTATATPFDTATPVQAAGEFAHADFMRMDIASQNPEKGLPALSTVEQPTLYDNLHSLTLDDVGTRGYCVYAFDAHGARQNAQAPFVVTPSTGWAEATMGASGGQGDWFSIDGDDGGYWAQPMSSSWVYANPSASIDIDADANWHYLTVFCPDQQLQAHAYTVTLTPQGRQAPAASYSMPMTETPGDDRIFQFRFTGNVTLTLKATGYSDAGGIKSSAILKALFLDDVQMFADK